MSSLGERGWYCGWWGQHTPAPFRWKGCCPPSSKDINCSSKCPLPHCMLTESTDGTDLLPASLLPCFSP